MNKYMFAGLFFASLTVSSVQAEEAVDPQQLFDEAIQLRDSGDIFTSIELFEQILSKQPGLQRARLELAVAYHQARRFYDAREQLMKVFNDSDTPEAVKLTIAAYLAQLGSDEKAMGKRTSASVFVSAGLFSDSNVNLGPAPETPGVGTAEVSGSGMVAMASYSHVSRASGPLIINKKPVDLSWHSQATVYGKMHTGEENDFNLHVLGLATGPELLADKNWRAGVNLKFDRIYYGGNPYSFNMGLNPSFTLIFGDTEIMIENLTTVREYSVDQGLDGVSKMYGMGVMQFLSSQTVAVEGGVRYHNNGASAQYLHSDGVEVYLGGQMPAWQDARAYVQLSTRNYGYTEADPSNSIHPTTARDETESRATLGVTHDFKAGLLKSWSLNGQLAHTKNNSNLDEFDYDRNVVEMNLRRYFY
jgi:tetratricopeptide (TPR) repeat protein